jgi:surface antigen
MFVCDGRLKIFASLIAVSVASIAAPAWAHGGAHHHGTASHAAGARHSSAGKHAGSAHHASGSKHLASAHHGSAGRHLASDRHHQHRYASVSGAHVIQCVAFAKQDAGIEISGNARDWWDHAAGVYDRGSQPEPGSVLSFRPTGRMRLGHVAVVSGVVDSRTIMIDQSHWNSRGISRDMVVKDVSENNDWTEVRVQLSRGGAFGSIYPTHGFIYPRPDSRSVDRGIVHAVAHGHQQRALEVAEAPKLDLAFTAMTFDAPNRDLR